MKRFLRRNKQLVSRLLPAFFIFILFALGFLNIFSTDLGKTIVLITLLILTPIIFFFNGFISQKFNKQFLFFSIPSYISFTIVFFIWLNSSALSYFVLYLISNILGFLFYKLDRKLSKKNNIKLDNTGFYSEKNNIWLKKDQVG